MNRTTLSLIAGTAALAAVTGFAALSAPDASGDSTAKTAVRLPVERTRLLCPEPSSSDLAETSYTSFTPEAQGASASGKAELTVATEQSADDAATGGKTHKNKKQSNAPTVTPKKPGTPATGDSSGADTPALIGTATGEFAPGWTVQQTTRVTAGSGRGLLGLNCTAADTEFWFPGVAIGGSRTDYVHLTNPDDAAAVVDIELYGKDGSLKSEMGEGIRVKAHSSEPVLLSTLTEAREDDLTLHVSVRSGRIAAAVQALDDKTGGDWLAAATDPAGSLVLPGIPKDATDVRLIAFAPGESDADLTVRLASPSGRITPAGNESLHVKSRMTATMDLGDVTRGEAGSLLLTPSGGTQTPVVAALRVVRGKGDHQETAFIPATAPVGTRASVTGNTAKGTTLALTAPESAATVKVTASAGSKGGTAATKQYTIKAGTTRNVDDLVPSGLEGTYALTVETVSGGPVYAARTLEATDGGVPAFTVQTLPDDRGTVAVPHAEQDLSVLLKK
ncbi:DUF5719 family protein [Streptomyces sp. NPDC052051]|uniref:DUF5719 family protein n=1 Tax=Streptomyces sp. NPDC052051 TaxID=3154649 RepID=UPI00342528A7